MLSSKYVAGSSLVNSIIKLKMEKWTEDLNIQYGFVRIFNSIFSAALFSFHFYFSELHLVVFWAYCWLSAPQLLLALIKLWCVWINPRSAKTSPFFTPFIYLYISIPSCYSILYFPVLRFSIYFCRSYLPLPFYFWEKKRYELG